MIEYTNVIAKVLPQVIGCAELVHDTPSPIERIRAAMDGQPLDREKYARLLVRGQVMMTDAEFERRTNKFLLHYAHGRALIAGLGIGLILDPLLSLCDSVTVIEKEQDVISLVAPYFPTVKVIHADIFDWKPAKGEKFNTIYFDIWPDICEDDLAEAKKLHLKFRRHLAVGGHMRSWTTVANQALRGSR